MESIGNFLYAFLGHSSSGNDILSLVQVPDKVSPPAPAPPVSGPGAEAANQAVVQCSPNNSILAHTAPTDSVPSWNGEPLSSYSAGTESNWAGWAASTQAPPAAAAAAGAPVQQLASSSSIIERFNPLVTTDAADRYFITLQLPSPQPYQRKRQPYDAM